MDANDLFEILVRENSSMLVAYLRASIRDANVVDDLYQETMLVAWRRLNDYDRDIPFGAWLRGIASKLILAHYRRNASKKTMSMDEETLAWFNDQFTRLQKLPGDGFMDKLEALRQCIAALPEHYQSPIRLRYQRELELSAVATVLQINLDGLKKRLSRAKLQLHDCIQRKMALLESST